MSILITSFKRASKLTAPAYHRFSVAVYQPREFSFPRLEPFLITDSNGKWIRPRNFEVEDNRGTLDPLRRYHKALRHHYIAKLHAWHDWLLACERTGMEQVALCCWCPYDRAAQRQIKEFGSFVCHTAVIYELLREVFHADAYLDADRAEGMVRLWELSG